MTSWLTRMVKKVKIQEPETRPPDDVAEELETLKGDTRETLRKKTGVLEEFRSIERAAATGRRR